MAVLKPSWEIINNQKVPPTDGERTLLNFLLKHLDDTYEVFYQPYLNGDQPDIIIMRRNSGVMIIEVKDWSLDSYYMDDKTHWRLLKNDSYIKSPFRQVEAYKSNLFNLHSEELYFKKIIEPKSWATVNCAVFFSKQSERSINEFLNKDLHDKKYDWYRKQLKYFGILGYDSLTAEKLTALMKFFWMDYKSKYFDDALYYSCKRFFQPPIHQIEDGTPIRYNKKQTLLIESELGGRRKIKGPAGCGKTFVLAKRSVNAYLRTESKVLILTYNLSLKNYIHDRISEVRSKFPWDGFYLTNYHQFIKTQANNYNLELQGLSAWNSLDFFAPVKSVIQPFDAIFVDEVQDYEQVWLDIIITYFAHSETELVVFGDEKQNIYDRSLDENRELKVRTIPGKWNRSLNTSFRFGNKLGRLSLKFQKHFFNAKYQVDEILKYSEIDFEGGILEYNLHKTLSEEQAVEEIFNFLKKHMIHSSDTGVICSRVEFLRGIELIIRKKKHEHTMITFETQEEFDAIKNNIINQKTAEGYSLEQVNADLSDLMEPELKDARRMRKNNFWMKSGTLKLSTIHSFKGWEIPTVFLVIERDEVERSNDELIYTAITRAKKNLVILNVNNSHYHTFFSNEII